MAWDQINQLLQQGVAMLAALGVVIEISPIKINPIRWLLKWAGRAVNEDLRSDLQDIKSDVETLSKRIDDNEIDRLRWEILDFANSCKNNRKHTVDEFKHIIEVNAKYHKILIEANRTNGLIDVEYQYIEDTYRKCLSQKAFL